MQALLALMREKKFVDITIKEITERADVSRQTFYRHFQSKEDIVKAYSDRLCAEISGEISTLSEKSLYELCLVYFRFWHEYAALLQLAMESGCEHLLAERYNAAMMESLDVLRASLPQYSDAEFLFVKSFLLGGFYNTKLTWMNADFQQSPEELARLISSLFDKAGEGRA